MNALLIAALSVAVIALVLYRQLRTRRVTGSLRLPLILLIIGVVQIADYVTGHGGVGPGHILAAATGMVIAGVLAVPRVRTSKVFVGADGTWYCKGTWATLGWWLGAFVVHAAAEAAIPMAFGERPGGAFTGVTTCAFLGITLLAQGYLMRRRVTGRGVELVSAA